MNSKAHHHVVIFPFMSKGHTIPLLHLARLLLHRFHRLSLTIFTTKSNHSFISDHFLSSSSVSIIDLPFPKHVYNLPLGVETTENLPSGSLFPEFCTATKLMQPHFETHLRSLPHVCFLISDGFLWWTLESASKFGIPRFSFYGFSNYISAVSTSVFRDGLIFKAKSVDELITVTDFPSVKVTRSDFDPAFLETDQMKSLHSKFLDSARNSTSNSHGLIVNSFYELESVFCDYLKNNEIRPKSWCIGPLCLVEQITTPMARTSKPRWLEWLDQKLHHGKSVLYVAFGSQADVSVQQMKEIESGLEDSGVNFLWAKKEREGEVEDGFEERVRERGIVVREWAEQWEILKHESVKGFMSHCGWNSVMESVCCGVPILALPLMADQALNARMVVEEMKVGLRAVENCGGSVKGFVERKELEKKVRELMEGDKGKRVREKSLEISKMAKKAMEEGGSSWKTLQQLVEESCTYDKEKSLSENRHIELRE